MKPTLQPKRLFLGFFLGGLLILGLLPIWLERRAEKRVASEKELSDALMVLMAHFQEGDAVRVEPSWWTLPLQALSPLRDKFQDEKDPILRDEVLAPVDVLPFQRLFVLSGFKRKAEAPKYLDFSKKESLFESRHLELAVYALGPGKLLRSLSDEWEGLSVSRNSKKSPKEWKPCPFEKDKLRCHRQSWLDLYPKRDVVGHHEVTWLWAHPGPPGETLELSWKDLETQHEGQGTWLLIRAGATWNAMKHAPKGTVWFRVFIDDEEVDHFEILANKLAVPSRLIGLGHLPKDKVNLRLQLTTDEDARRHTLLEAELLTDLPKAFLEWPDRVLPSW